MILLRLLLPAINSAIKLLLMFALIAVAGTFGVIAVFVAFVAAHEAEMRREEEMETNW